MIKIIIIMLALIGLNLNVAANLLMNGDFNIISNNRPEGWSGGINTQCISGGIGNGYYWQIEENTVQQTFTSPIISTTAGTWYTFKGYYQATAGILTMAIVDNNNSILCQQALPETKDHWIAFFDEFQASTPTCSVVLSVATQDGIVKLEDFSVRPGRLVDYSAEFSPQVPNASAAFPIVGWVPPAYYAQYPFATRTIYNKDRMHAEYAYANFTTYGDTRFGVKRFLAGNEYLDPAKTTDLSMVWGYMGCDEPVESEFPGIATLKNSIKALFPDMIFFNNLLPLYGSFPDNPGDEAGTAYKNYVNNYISIVEPDFVTFDYYALQGGAAPIYSTYIWQNLQVFKEALDPINLPWGIFLQLIQFGSLRSPTEGELRWQAYSSLAYGAKMIGWFTFLTPIDSQLNAQDAAIDINGNRGRHFAMLRELNGEILQLGPTLLRLKSTGVFHSLPLPRPDYCYPIEQSLWVDRVTDGVAVVGEFIDQTDNTAYILVVNRDFMNTAQLKLTLNEKVKGVRMVSAVNGQMENETLLPGNRILEVELPAGDGRLFCIVRNNLGLVGHWRLDETSGTIAADDSGYRNDGTLMYGPVWTSSGKIAGALNLDGTDDRIIINNVAVDTNTGASNTVTFWMKWNGTMNDMPFGWDSGYALIFASGSFGINTAEGNILGIPSDGLAGQWVHVAVVFPNGVPNAANTKIYINGVSRTVTARQGTTTQSRTATSKIYISGWHLSGYRFGGAIDDVRIYNKALSASDVSDLANLAGHWRLDETSGTIAADDSGYRNDGTLMYGPVWTSSGKIAGALNLDGTDDRIIINNVAVDTNTGASNTVTFWMKWIGTMNDMPFGWDSGYALIFASGSFGINTAEGNILGISSDGLAGQWVHVAVVFPNGVPNAANTKIYINGVSRTVTARQGTTTQSRTATSKIYISGWHLSGYRFGGAIDDVRIYNRALNSDEINNLIN